ncbi:unnamed protein product [Spirodela intermedia]|uniref:AtPDCT1/2 transmembrane domain-containing protein n=1 Tax=Spirodela intermedia TaxID=51605 RepID=A0A7I8IWK9_SPIIN|nr:unnamed protein product [Spirodela intermedia]CAA6662064.1 unnamed protein product [Spirodela intermedia]
MSNGGKLIPLLLKTPDGAAVGDAKEGGKGVGEQPETENHTGLARRRPHGGSNPLNMTSRRGTAGDGGDATRRNALAGRFSMEEVAGIVHGHPIPCFFALCVLFFMMVEYTLFMVFVVMQAAYILSTLLIEGRGRSTIAVVFMFTCRGILGYSTQLPLPQEFLGSGVDFPVGNVSFFLFFSGHVAGSVIASLDMRRTGRQAMAAAFDALNLLQVLRLLATRGHYSIDLAAGVGAGVLFDVLAGKYEKSHRRRYHLAAAAEAA